MKFIFPFVITMVIILVSASCSQAKQAPNIVVILADDLGYGDLGCYGCPDIQTPNIDELALGGVKFTNFYSNAPECTPTRAAFLTGRYQQRVGGLDCAIGAGNVGRYDEAMWLSDRTELGLPVDESTLINSLKEAGYATALLGKWHLGYEKKFRPDRHGFDYSFCLLGGLGDYFYHTELVDPGQEDFTPYHTLAENGKEVFHDGEYLTELITEKAIDWLDNLDREKSFFLYLPYTAPHLPYQGPQDDIGRSLRGDEDAGSRGKYAEMVESLDQEIGRIIKYLESEDLAEKTLIIFFSDNGGTTFANNGIFRADKGTVFEGGIHVPCIIQWHGHVPQNKVSEQTCISFDLTRAILELIGVLPETKLDGYNILNHVIENQEDIPRTLFWRARRGERLQKAVRDGEYKYLIRTDGDLVIDEGLYDLFSDPSEQNNLLLNSPELVDKLRKKVTDWEEDVRAPRLFDWYNQGPSGN
ncbi:sulfatase [Bacteroidota bacterium]